MATHRRIDVSKLGDVTVVRFVDKKILEEASIQELGAELFGLVEQDNRKAILLEFGNVEFLSSAALGKLITLDRKVKTHKGRLKLCGIRRPSHAWKAAIASGSSLRMSNTLLSFVI